MKMQINQEKKNLPIPDAQPPNKLILKLKGKPKEEHHDFEGVYSIVPGISENGYPYWLHDNGIYSIWHEKSLAAWVVGYIDGLGSDNGVLVSPLSDEAVGEIKKAFFVILMIYLQCLYKCINNTSKMIAQPSNTCLHHRLSSHQPQGEL